MLYPLKFEPILKDKIWGGTKLKNIFSIKPATSDKLGELELSGARKRRIGGHQWLSARQTNLPSWSKYTWANWLDGQSVLIFRTYLSLLMPTIIFHVVQVHPGDEAAERHNSFGKTEMWYVVECWRNAELIIGSVKIVRANEYMDALDDK